MVPISWQQLCFHEIETVFSYHAEKGFDFVKTMFGFSFSFRRRQVVPTSWQQFCFHEIETVSSYHAENGFDFVKTDSHYLVVVVVSVALLRRNQAELW